MIDGGQSRYVSIGRVEGGDVSLSAKILKTSMMAQLGKLHEVKEYHFLEESEHLHELFDPKAEVKAYCRMFL